MSGKKRARSCPPEYELTTPFHPLPWQELEVCFFAERFEQQAAGEVVDIPVSTWQRAPLASPAACPTTAP